MHKEEIRYEGGGKELRGYLCHHRDLSGPRPGVIIAHAWRGLDAFARQQAERLAELGYMALAADVYGIDHEVESDEEAKELMLPLFLDRELLQERIVAAYTLLKNQSLVDPQRIGAIGFCFGGLTAIELLRSGCGVNGVVSFHGVLGNSMGDQTAKTVPLASGIKGELLILHGHEDPLVSEEDIILLQDEMTEADVDWQFVIYGHTSHAFTNPEAQNNSAGLVYNEQAARRSWVAATYFLNEVFSHM